MGQTQGNREQIKKIVAKVYFGTLLVPISHVMI